MDDETDGLRLGGWASPGVEALSPFSWLSRISHCFSILHLFLELNGVIPCAYCDPTQRMKQKLSFPGALVVVALLATLCPRKRRKN